MRTRKRVGSGRVTITATDLSTKRETPQNSARFKSPLLSRVTKPSGATITKKVRNTVPGVITTYRYSMTSPKRK